MFAGIDSIQHHEPCIVHPAIRISKARRNILLERSPFLARAQVEAARAAQAFARGEPIVKEEASLNHESRAHALIKRQDEASRPNDMRRDAKQNLPLPQCLPHEAEFVVFEISQPAMNELA